METADQVRLYFEGLTLDLAARTLIDGSGREVSLRRSEYELLRAFVDSPGRALSRDLLLETIAGRRSEPYDRSIDVLVGRLRRKIEPEPKQPRLILTVPGVGYRFAVKPHSGPLTVDVEIKTEPAPQYAPTAPERRQLTIMRCALSGPASSAARRDPEDLLRLLAAFHTSCAEIITRGGGTVARLLDDGLLAYFGYPQAREYQAECAVRAALGLIEAIRHIDADSSDSPTMHARIGIATGFVIVGDLLGSASGEPSALGEAPGLAARLVALAEPDTVLLSAATRRLVGELFQYRETTLSAFNDDAKPVAIWQVIGEGTARSRFEALHGFEVSDLVGREEELGLLQRRWEQASAGAGRAVLVAGEPGIGKSRLVRALEDRIDGETHLRLRCSCSPHHQDSTLYPVITQLEGSANFVRDDSPSEKLAKLEALLARSSASDEAIALIAQLLAIDTGERYFLPEMSPPMRRERTLTALLGHLSGLSSRKPVLLIYEDVHWTDPTSLELLARIVEILVSMPVLLLITARPEFAPPWPDHAHVTTIQLNRLDKCDSASLVRQITSGEPLPAEVLQQILTRTDGVPLFIEELTKTVLENVGQSGSVATALTIPATLQASLMARLDRLPAAKEVAQIGAVIGREFPHALLTAVARLPEERLTRGLDEFVASGLAFRRGLASDAIYTFKHALVQDAAYESILRSRRAEIHAHIVGAMESDEETGGRQPILLGYHCAQAGLMEKAATYYRQAGDQSKTRWALAETKTLLDRGLAVAASLPDSPGRRLLETELWAALGRLLQIARSWGDGDALIALGRAIDLARTLDSTEPLTDALRDRALNLLLRGDHEAGWRDAQELCTVAEAAGDSKRRIFAHTTRGYFQFASGHFGAACTDLQTAQELFSREPDAAFDATLNPNWAVGIGFFLAQTLACLGHVDRAIAQVAQLSEGAHRAAPFPRAVILNGLCRFALIMRDMAALQEYTSSLASIGQEMGSLYVQLARYYRSYLEVCGGSAPTAIQEMRTVLTALGAMNYQFCCPYYRLLLADGLILADQTTAAKQALDDGLALSASNGQTWSDAELHRRKGELLLGGDELNATQAEQELRLAIDIARAQEAKLFELRATTRLAQLLSGQGRCVDARKLLAPVCAWFAEGIDIRDLREAHEVLAA